MKNFTSLSFIFLTAICLYSLYKIYRSFYEETIYDGFFWIPIITFGAILAMWIFLKNLKDYSLNKRFSSFYTTLAGILLISTAIAFQLYRDALFNRMSLLYAHYDGDTYGSSIDLKSDGKYIFSNGSFMGVKYFYGQYTLLDSIITLDKSEIDNVIQSERLVIKTISSEDKILYQISTEGFQIDKYLIFRVIDDNR